MLARMDIGVIFPQTELGADRGAVRAIGQAVDELGYTHLAAYDHVLGGDVAVHGDIGGPYTIDDPFREPLVMFAYLAACTDLAFATSILIGPQRQTALLAKQAAELDLLCGGRLRLGLGIGWNKLEYDALGVPFDERAAILEEQIPVLRALWTQKSVTVDGRFHHIRAAGLEPLPVQRPIPIWIGGHAPAALRRVGRVADGWFPMWRPGGGLEQALELIREGAAEAGRDLSGFQFEGRLEYSVRDHETIAEHARRWRAAGASHLSVNTMHSGLESVDAHVAALEEVAQLLL
jgi:probable F420-dependent oxidoreductase